MDDMISINSFGSISNLFIHMTATPCRVTLWQNIDNIHRVRAFARLAKIDVEAEEIEFTPRKGVFDFKSAIPLYFWGKRSNTIFKTNIRYNSDLKIVIKLPKDIMIQDSRSEPRLNYTSEELYVQYMYGGQRDSNLDYMKLKSRLLDLSDNGLSFKSSLNNIVRFREGDKLRIESTSQDKKFMDSHISYITTVLDPKTMQRYYRVGVKFD
jgi:hypothetical protein